MVDKVVNASKGYTLLHQACLDGDSNAASQLLRRGAQPNRRSHRGSTAAHCAARHPALLVLLAESGADLELRDNSGNAPLHRALVCDAVGSVAALLRLGADPDMRNADGWTPLLLARKSERMTRLLCAAGARPSITGGKRMLGAAGYSDNEEVAEALRQHLDTVRCVLIAGTLSASSSLYALKQFRGSLLQMIFHMIV